LAGFQVTLLGRFWVTAEDKIYRHVFSLCREAPPGRGRSDQKKQKQARAAAARDAGLAVIAIRAITAMVVVMTEGCPV
jgi:hypothetical protein